MNNVESKEMQKSVVTGFTVIVNCAIATLTNGEKINFLKIQEVLNDAYCAHGDLKYSDAAQELAKLTLQVQDGHGDWRPVDTQTPQDAVLPGMTLTGPELIYQDDAYADVTMYIKVTGGDWKLTVSRDMETNSIYESIEYGDDEKAFDETALKMPSEVRALFDLHKSKAEDILNNLVRDPVSLH